MSNELTVVDQKEVVFYDDELSAIKAGDGRIYVGLRQMCSALGIDANGQVQRIRRHVVLSEGQGSCKLQGPAGGTQTANVLRVDLVPLWLSGIRANSVREDIRPKLVRFQKEAANVLWEAFTEGRLSTDNTLDELVKADTPEAKAYLMAKAIYDMARQQLLLSNRLESQGRAIETNTQRIEAIEAELGNPDRFISVSQTAELSDAVRAIGLLFSQATGANEYGKVYGELYRRYSINSYKRLPAAKFDEALNWLRNWYEDLADGDAAPF